APLMPAALVATLTIATHGRAGWRPAAEAAPFALAVGLVHTVTAAFIARVAGPEFPSIGGPAVGLAAGLLMVSRRWLLPRTVWRFEGDEPPQQVAQAIHAISPLRAASPYVAMVVLLALTRVRSLPLAETLGSVQLGWRNVLGTGLDALVQPLSSPGAVLVVCAALAVAVFGMRPGDARRAVADAGRVALRTGPTLLASIATVRLFIHSDVNGASLEAMPMVLASGASAALGFGWPFFAPWLGALGSFVAGSATFSNMLFSLLQSTTAEQLGLPVLFVLALQGMGAAVGNMVCVHNVVAACAVVGIAGQEGRIIRRTAAPMLVYLLLAGSAALVLLALGWMR
ncbi:MAG: L-lactate permease, partial [Myxococcales bacterium]